MKKYIACLFLSLLIAMPARAADYLKQSYDLALITAFMVLDYDACVKQGFINDDKPSAAARFQAAIDKSRADNAAGLPPHITKDQVADAMQKALNDGRAATVKKPQAIDRKTCDAVAAHWPQFAKQSGLE